jgi:hypothetical protein
MAAAAVVTAFTGVGGWGWGAFEAGGLIGAALVLVRLALVRASALAPAAAPASAVIGGGAGFLSAVVVVGAAGVAAAGACATVVTDGGGGGADAVRGWLCAAVCVCGSSVWAARLSTTTSAPPTAANTTATPAANTKVITPATR